MNRQPRDNSDQGVLFAPLGGGWQVSPSARAEDGEGARPVRDTAPTSLRAATGQTRRKIAGDRYLILELLAGRGAVDPAKNSGGATRDEINAKTKILTATVCARVGELTSPAMGELVRVTAARRKTRSGQAAEVLEITAAGLAEYQAARERLEAEGEVRELQQPKGAA